MPQLARSITRMYREAIVENFFKKSLLVKFLETLPVQTLINIGIEAVSISYHLQLINTSFKISKGI
jgi:hypothetical protein